MVDRRATASWHESRSLSRVTTGPARHGWATGAQRQLCGRTGCGKSRRERGTGGAGEARGRSNVTGNWCCLEVQPPRTSPHAPTWKERLVPIPRRICQRRFEQLETQVRVSGNLFVFLWAFASLESLDASGGAGVGRRPSAATTERAPSTSPVPSQLLTSNALAPSGCTHGVGAGSRRPFQPEAPSGADSPGQSGCFSITNGRHVGKLTFRRRVANFCSRVFVRHGPSAENRGVCLAAHWVASSARYGLCAGPASSRPPVIPPNAGQSVQMIRSRKTHAKKFQFL